MTRSEIRLRKRREVSKIKDREKKKLLFFTIFQLHLIGISRSNTFNFEKVSGQCALFSIKVVGNIFIRSLVHSFISRLSHN